MREVKRLQAEGPRYYKLTAKNDQLYSLTKEAFYAIRRGEPDKAWEQVRLGRELDQHNPVFDYLEASMLWAKGDRKGCVKTIDTGNARGVLRAYATTLESPNMWQWPEIDQIKNVGMEIVGDPHSTKDELISVLKLGHKIAFSSPSDFRRLMQGSTLRKRAAQRLLPIAKEEGNTRLEKLCEELISESVRLRAEAKRRLAEDDSFRTGSQAWVVSRALDEHNIEFRRAAMLLMREKQAEWGTEFRSKHFKIENLRNL